MKPLNARTSYAMSKVRQKGTDAEERVAFALRELGVRYRRNVRSLPGTPDFANRKRGWVIQVHGCFWHGHDCKRGTLPAHNREAWEAKLARNKTRDIEVEQSLIALGLNVATIWECELKDVAALKNRLSSYVR
ncbi:very short patch repair endonuclease [Brevundimonas sp. SH203]|uniref:very short patch repair endonuclease n=1 Tax=Brevundimonas sp. SH203 TaxID=345167 RepID=UPI000B364488|nr:very short patch repair endonuclease [Brevundimonas sp. SH203]